MLELKAMQGWLTKKVTKNIEFNQFYDVKRDDEKVP